MTVGEFWPEKYVLKNEWTLNHQQNAPMSLSGNSVSVEHGEPYWTADVSVTVPTDSDYLKIWSSFFARRKGRKNTFTMNRSFQTFPQNKDIITDENFSITSIDRASGSIGLFGQPQQQLVSPGDMISFFTASNGYYIGEVLSRNEQASSVLFVDPPPFTPHPETQNARRIKPIGEFRLDAIPNTTETNKRRTWNFSATQVIRG